MPYLYKRLLQPPRETRLARRALRDAPRFSVSIKQTLYIQTGSCFNLNDAFQTNTYKILKLEDELILTLDYGLLTSPCTATGGRGGGGGGEVGS